MTKLYKAVDRTDPLSGDNCWLVNDKGVAVSYWFASNEEEIENNKFGEEMFAYDNISRFHSDAIDPVLIAEW